MLEVESGISPEIIGGRGYRTVSRADVPDDFASYQRRNGLLIPLYSPDGTTTASQLRADRPRRDKRGKPIKYETPTGGRIIADTHPRMLGAVADPSVPLWITEGTKKGDALASRGRCAVALIGVWMFRPKGSDNMLPCFDYVALTGRRVFVVYDSDIMHKPEVAMALERLVGDLAARGARSLVVYLPDAPDGGKLGVDDYLAAGGTVEHLEEIARPFTPADAARERLGRDAPLRDRIAALWRIWGAEAWRGTGGHTRREVMRAMIEDATRRGKTATRGVRVASAQRPLAERVGVRRNTVADALRTLEAVGLIARDKSEDRAPDAPAYYVLLTSGAPLWRAGGGHKGKTGGEWKRRRGAQGERSAGRESNPGGPPTRAPLTEIKRLRWSYVARDRDPDGKGYIYRYIRRLDKTAGRLLEALIAEGGAASVGELAQAVSARRTRDLVRDDRALRVRPVKPLPDRTVIEYDRAGRVGAIVRLADAGIVRVSEAGERVTLADDWPEKLGLARELGGEYDAERRTRERHARARRAYKARRASRADRGPTEAEMDRAREARRERADGTADDLRRLSPLAAAMANYLERNPHDAAQPPGWIGATLWARDLYPERVTPAECRAALAELGGERYLHDKLRQSRGA
jgi:predicted transcriptional regulator